MMVSKKAKSKSVSKAPSRNDSRRTRQDQASKTSESISNASTAEDEENKQDNSTSPQKKKKGKVDGDKKVKYLTRKQANSLVIECGIAIQKALGHLDEARQLTQKAGMTVDSHILPRQQGGIGTGGTGTINNSSSGGASGSGGTGGSGSASGNSNGANNNDSNALPIPIMPNQAENTGGHSNTDHVVLRTGDERKDRIAELKRNLIRRYRSMQPENRGEDRWDQPKISGGRRRRIVREKDLPEAPPEPPPTGYVVFVGQMTTKIRHDRPNVPHDQAKVVQEISKIWRLGMSEDDRIYYNDFAMDAKKEYETQVIEYRATGSYTPSKEFDKLPDVNVWVRRNFQNGLEREISQYDTCQFPKRPKEMDEAYERREERSKLKRKLKLKGLYNDDGTLKDGLDFEELLIQERQKQRKLNENGKDADSGSNNNTDDATKNQATESTADIDTSKNDSDKAESTGESNADQEKNNSDNDAGIALNDQSKTVSFSEDLSNVKPFEV